MSNDNFYYNQETHGPFKTHNIGNLVLKEGGTIRDCFLAYQTFGQLNDKKDNAILITTWFSGTSKIMETTYIGDDRALNPTKYFIIIINQIGNGLSSSPNNTPMPFNGPRFPKVHISDDVRAQHRLLTSLFDIKSLELVMGGSMGAMQTYEWAVRYPDMVKRAAPIAGTAKSTNLVQLYSETVVEAITSDPAWNDGWYGDSSLVHKGLRRQAKVFGTMCFSPELFVQEAWTELGFSSCEDFIVGFLENYFLPMDPNALIMMAWKWKRADVSNSIEGDLKQALNKITARVSVMPIEHDMIFPIADCHAECEMIPNSQFRPITSQWAHLGLFGLEESYFKQIDQHLSELLGQE